MAETSSLFDEVLRMVALLERIAVAVEKLAEDPGEEKQSQIKGFGNETH